ncbi:MAG: hypothetical protein AB7P24_21780 [Nitrospira sp.]
MPPSLDIERAGGEFILSGPESSEGWRPEVCTEAVGSPWAPVTEVPVAVGQRWSVRIAGAIGTEVLQIVKAVVRSHGRSGVDERRHCEGNPDKIS